MPTEKLPDDVDALRWLRTCTPRDELSDVADKLIVDTPDLAAMWRALERRRVDTDDLWVWAFLSVAHSASALPPFHYMSARERQSLSRSISQLADELARKLESSGLDVSVVYTDGKIFDGFFAYEDFGESNRRQIDSSGIRKLKVSDAIRGTAERAAEKIANEPLPGKIGKNVRAIRFVRLVAERNRVMYGVPLNFVTATAANAMFGTTYAESDVRKLLTR